MITAQAATARATDCVLSCHTTALVRPDVDALPTCDGGAGACNGGLHQEDCSATGKIVVNLGGSCATTRNINYCQYFADENDNAPCQQCTSATFGAGTHTLAQFTCPNRTGDHDYRYVLTVNDVTGYTTSPPTTPACANRNNCVSSCADCCVSYYQCSNCSNQTAGHVESCWFLIGTP